MHRNLVNGSICLILALLALGAAPLPAADWPWYGGPTRDWVSAERDWLTQWPAQGVQPLWTAEAGIGFAPLSVAGGLAVALGNTSGTETVLGLDALTGRERWRHSYPCPLRATKHEGGPTAAPVIANGRVYTMSRVGDLFCLDAADGRIVWQRELSKELGVKVPEFSFIGSPMLVGDRLFVDIGVMAAYDAATGAPLWRSDYRDTAYANPHALTFRGREAVAGLDDHGLTIFDASSGEPLSFISWVPRADSNLAKPLFLGDRVFISAGYYNGAAMIAWDDAGATRTLWKSKAMRNHFYPSYLIDGAIVGMDGNFTNKGLRLKALDKATGALLWEHTGFKDACALRAGDKLIVLTETGQLILGEASRQGFRKLATMPSGLTGKCWTMPVLANGILYLRNAAGHIRVLDLRLDAKIPASR